MPADPESNGSRLDRIERALDRLVITQADHHIAQLNLFDIVNRVVTVVETLAGKVVQIAEAQRLADEKIAGLAQRMDELAQAQRHSDERLNGLINVVDGLVRRQPPPQPAA